MNLPLSLNDFQLAIILLQAKRQYTVSGRGFGKSSLFGYKQHQIVSVLPGSSTVITAKTYTHVLTSILPSAFAQLERMGYMRDTHYVIGKQAPKSWGELPYNAPIRDFSNYITFFNPIRTVGFSLTSQERVGLGRGPNNDFAMTDETLNINKDRFNKEITPTVRANKDKFKHISWHLGEDHYTSMPITQDARWILDQGLYYLEQYGIDYFSLWRQVVNMQLELLDITDLQEFKRLYNEMMRVRRQMLPMLSKDGETLFTLSNAFDNYQNVGLSYLREQRKKLPEAIFLIEIMNMMITLNENCFYAINEDKHIYYDSYDDDLTNNYAISTDFDFSKLSKKQCHILSRKYYNPNNPLMLFFDWGGTVSFCLSAQFDKARNTLYIIKECYVMPGGEMSTRLMQEFLEFFEPHENKTVYFVRDTYGDSKSIQKSKSINEEAISYLQKMKWKVIPRRHQFKEPPMFEKWQLMQKIMKEGEENTFRLRIDGNNCKYLTIAMRDTKVKQVGNELSKDKSLERKESADQRKAPHSTDALDKGCYWLFKENKSDMFIPVKT